MFNKFWQIFLFVCFSFISVNSQTDKNETFNYDIKYFYNQKGDFINYDVSKLTFKDLPKNNHFGINNGTYLF